MTHPGADRIRALVERGATDEAMALADASLPGAAGIDRAELLLALSHLHTHRGAQVAALSAAVEAGQLFREAGLPQRVCDALTLTANTLRTAGDHETALSTLEHAEALTRDAGDELRRGRVLRSIGIVSSLLGRHQQAQSCLEEACALLGKHGSADEQRGARLSQLNGISRRLEAAGFGSAALDEVTAHLNDWHALATATSAAGQTRIALMAWGNHAITLRVAGQAREAADALLALLPRYRDAGMRPNEGLALAELGHCHLALGDSAMARTRYREACALLREAGTQDDLMDALEGVERTIDVHIRNLRMKVEDDPQKPTRICTVWGKGYRFAAGEEGRL